MQLKEKSMVDKDWVANQPKRVCFWIVGGKWRKPTQDTNKLSTDGPGQDFNCGACNILWISESRPVAWKLTCHFSSWCCLILCLSVAGVLQNGTGAWRLSPVVLSWKAQRWCFKWFSPNKMSDCFIISQCVLTIRMPRQYTAIQHTIQHTLRQHTIQIQFKYLLKNLKWWCMLGKMKHKYDASKHWISVYQNSNVWFWPFCSQAPLEPDPVFSLALQMASRLLSNQIRVGWAN